jgi:hypothetical protein
MLEHEWDELVRMSARQNWVTTDPLGIGGLLVDACVLDQLPDETGEERERIEQLLMAAIVGLLHYALRGDYRLPPSRRLPFRELGLAIGLSAVDVLGRRALDPRRNADDPPPRRARRTCPSALVHRRNVAGCEPPTVAELDAPPGHQRGDINEVMLAACLAPEGLLLLEPPADDRLSA